MSSQKPVKTFKHKHATLPAVHDYDELLRRIASRM